jgi:3-oxoacyl-[acyl-carrier-protein] synthase II
MNNIYITGIGILSTIGNGVEEFWQGLINPKEANIEREQIIFEFSRIDKKVLKKINRISKGALLSSIDALDNSLLYNKNIDLYDIGTVFYSKSTSLDSLLDFYSTVYSKGNDYASPLTFQSTVANSCVGSVAVNLKLKGFSTMLNTINYLIYSILALKNNKAKVLLCGGYEAYNKELFDDYKNNEYVIKKPKEPARPFDISSNGFKVKEGMATLVLQRGDSPYINKKSILCEILQGSAVYSSDIYPMCASSEYEPNDFIDTMTCAIEQEGLKNEDIDGIFMAANGNKYLDVAESKAIKNVFGERSKCIPITSIKGIVGETIGANLNINIAAAALSIKNGLMPGSKYTNYLNDEVDINIIMENTKGDFKYILVNGVCAMGGVVSHIIKKYREEL